MNINKRFNKPALPTGRLKVKCFNQPAPKLRLAGTPNALYTYRCAVLKEIVSQLNIFSSFRIIKIKNGIFAV